MAWLVEQSSPVHFAVNKLLSSSPMSEEQLKAFIAKVKDDQSIQDQLMAAKSPEDVVGIA